MSKKYNFKVGDRVRIRQWDDMVKEFGVDFTGDIKCTRWFTPLMKHLCGRIATIKSMSDYDIYLDFENKEGRTNFVYSTDMIEPANQCIVIYRKGSEVFALDKATGKQTVSKCHPEDEFDFNVGAKLAFERLLGIEETKVKEVKRPAKVGEYIKIVNAKSVSTTNGKQDYKNGDILKVVKYDGHKYVDDVCEKEKAYYKNQIFKYADLHEYVVLEGYEPPKEEKNDVFCHEFKDGKTYVFRKELHNKRCFCAGWTTKVDGMIVKVTGEKICKVDDCNVVPEWCEEIDLAVGDMVEVVDVGFNYSTFDTWKGLKGYEQNYVRHKGPVVNKKYKLLNLEKHGSHVFEDESKKILALIQDPDTTQVFIINIQGIKKAE